MIDPKISFGIKRIKLACFASLMLLSSCIGVTVDERIAFRPQKTDVAPANSIAELDANMALSFTGGVVEGIWRLNSVPEGGLRVTFREDFVTKHPNRKLYPPMILTNGFIGEGTNRVAWTFYKRIAADGSDIVPTRPIVVHCAGNAGDRYNSGANYASKALEWADVFVFDYPGYGDTPGPANAANFEAVSNEVVERVTTLAKNRKLIFWGHSLGGFVCSRLAASTPSTDGLILETTAPNAAAVAAAWTPTYARPFVRARVSPSLATYDVVASAAKTKGPILVLGATRDEVLPVSLSRQVADDLKTRNATVTYHEFPSARHTNVPNQRDFDEVIAAFFKTVESQP